MATIHSFRTNNLFAVPTFVAFCRVSCKKRGITKVFHVFRQISLKGVASSCRAARSRVLGSSWKSESTSMSMSMSKSIQKSWPSHRATCGLWPFFPSLRFFFFFYQAGGVAFKMSLIICCSPQTKIKIQRYEPVGNAESPKPFSAF